MSFYFMDIISWLEAHQLPCIFKAMTHFDCPGCGMQRSIILLIRGDLAGSFLIYPPLIPVLLLFVLLTAHVIFNIKKGAFILKFAYIFCTGIILVSYIYKIITTKTL